MNVVRDFAGRSLICLAALAASVLSSPASNAQEVFRIGYMVDLNGPTSALTGPGAAEAA